MPGPEKYEVFIDGDCAFCQWARTRVEPFDTDDRLRFFDYNDPAVAAQAPYSRAELDQAVHVRAPDGNWFVGFQAWTVVLKAMPFLRWLGILLESRMFRNAGPSLYRWAGRNRHRLPGSPPPCRTQAAEAKPSAPPPAP